MMKKGIFPIFLLLVIIALAVVSCASKPPAEEIKPVAEPKKTEVSGSARVDEARQRAMDFEGPAYFPSDWETLEIRYADAKKSAGTDEAAYNSIADSYDDLFKRTVPLYAQAREDEILAAREDIIYSGLTRRFPDLLQDADKLALSAKDQYDAEDYYRARDTAAGALREYESLHVGVKAIRARQEIIDRDFISYDAENFEKADEIAQSALDKYDAGDKNGAKALAEEALLRYNIVLENGWTTYAAVRRATAVAEREAALSNKVNIASRDMFREADALYNQAEENFKAEKFTDAGVQFINAEALYVIANQETDGKRQRALETIRLAGEKIEESVETAIEAEKIIEGGSK